MVIVFVNIMQYKVLTETTVHYVLNFLVLHAMLMFSVQFMVTYSMNLWFKRTVLNRVITEGILKE